MKQSLFLFVLCMALVPFLLAVSPFVRTDGEPQVQGPLSVYNGFNLKTGVCTLSDDLLVDGGDIGVTGDTDLLQLSNGNLDVNGTSEFVGDMTITNAGGNSNSYKLLLQSHLIAGDETQTSSFYTAHGADPYLVVATPNAAGVETSTLHIRHDLLAFATDNQTDIGAAADNRPKNYHGSGSIVTNGSVTATTGNITASAGDLIVDGLNIGITADPDLVVMAANQFGINGTIAAKHAAHDFIPIEWCHDGAVAPAPAGEVDSGNGTVMAREFGGAAGNIVQDIVCPWEVPDDIVVATHIVYKISAVITNAVGPAAEGVSFKLSGYSIGDNDPINGAFGAEIEVTQQNYTAAQFDRMQTAYSGTVTVTNLAAGELVMLHFERDTADAQDDYAKPIGITGITVRSERLTEAF